MLPNPQNSDSGQHSGQQLAPFPGELTSPGGYFPPPLEPTPGESLNWISLLRKYWLLLLFLMLLGGSAGVISVVYSSPVYKAGVMLELSGTNQAWLKNSLDFSPSSDANDVDIQTQIVLLRAGPFMKRVFERLQSETVPLTPTGTDIFSRLRQRVRPSAQDPMQHVHQGLDVALRTFDARAINKTRLIELTCDSTSPEIASQFLNTIASEFIEETLRSRLQSSQKTSEWLSAQIEETKMKLEESEQRLQDFVRASGNVFANEETTLDDTKLAQLRTELSRIQADRIAKQTRYEVSLKNTELIPEVLDDAVLQGYKEKINELRREKAALETTFTANYHKVQKLDAQLAVVQGNLQAGLATAINRIKSDYEAALKHEKTLASAYNIQSGRVSSIAGKAAQYNALRREVETLRQMYQALLMQGNQAGLSNSVPMSPVRLVEPSTPARIPYKPRPILNISFGFIAGLALTGGVVFLREKFDRTVRSPGLTRTLMNAPELGVIPSTELEGAAPRSLLRHFRGRRNSGTYTLMRLDSSEPEHGNLSTLAESFRGTLASLLLRHGQGQAPKVILVTSAGPGEGKTLVAANLGIALAETGRRVLLIDTDFRRPRLHQVFQVPNERALPDLIDEHIGIADYSDDAVGVTTSIPGLRILPNRPAQKNISKLLYSTRLGEVIKGLRNRFDMIVIDAPPILDLADARIIAGLTDGAILVLRSGQTDRARAFEAYQRICEDGLTLFGTVLNDCKPEQKRYYYSYSESDEQP